MNIAFVHAGLTQFRGIHEYINANTGSTSWLLCSEGTWKAHRDKIPNLLPFPDPKENKETWYYVRTLEARVRRSFSIKSALLKLLAEHRIDVIVVHGSGGFPLQLYEEIPIPIVSYIEFPSFRAHGHDPRYPPSEAKRYRDKIYEMSNYHQAIKSDLVIVPSLYAKHMFPERLHSNIRAQMDGLAVDLPPEQPREERDEFRIGFIARDLSSAKGVDHFIAVAKEVHRHRPQCRFLICGSKDLRYSYEDDFLRSKADLPPEVRYLDYLLMREGIDLEDGVFQHVEFLDYNDFGSFVAGLDLVHYPLQFGSANWGLFECLFRAKKIIASNRCFIPEVITDGYNGLLCEYGDFESWTRRTIDVVDDAAAYDDLGVNAREDAERRFHVSVVAEKYLSILDEVLSSAERDGSARRR